MAKYCSSTLLFWIGSLSVYLLSIQAAAQTDQKVAIFLSLTSGTRLSCALQDPEKRVLISQIESSCLDKSSDGVFSAKDLCSQPMGGKPADQLLMYARMFCDRLNFIKQSANGSPVTREQRDSILDVVRQNQNGLGKALEVTDTAFALGAKDKINSAAAINSGVDSARRGISSLVGGSDRGSNKETSPASTASVQVDKPQSSAVSQNPAAANSSSTPSSDTPNPTTVDVDGSSPIQNSKNITKPNADDSSDIDFSKPAEAQSKATDFAQAAQPGAKQASQEMPTSVPKDAADKISGGANPTADALADARSKIDPKLATETGFKGKMSAAMQESINEAESIEAAVCTTTTTSPACIKARADNSALIGAVSKLNAKLESYSLIQKTCLASNSGANLLCDFVNNPKVLAVQGLMAVVTPILSKSSSARESCEILEKTNKIGQFGMAAANAMCVTAKTTCDMSCASSATRLTEMNADIEIIVNAAPTSRAAFTSALTTEKGPITTNIAQCKAHSISSKAMLMSAITLATSSKSASDCKQKLSAGSSISTSGMVAGATITTAEFCSKSENAMNVACKCSQNANAEGCFGSFSLNKGVATLNKNGQSGMVAGQTSSAISNKNFDNGSLTAEQKKALGFNTNSKLASDGALNSKTVDGFSAENSAVNGGLVDHNGVGQVDSKNAKASAFSFGSFSSGLSSFFGSGGSGKSKNSNGLPGMSAQKIQEQETAIKRKLASDQVRSEVSTASGKSNFDKVRNRYQMTTSSLFTGQ